MALCHYILSSTQLCSKPGVVELPNNNGWRCALHAPPYEQPLAAPFDVVNKPKHYTLGKVECIDAIESATLGLDGFEGALVFQVIKYIWRWKQKNGVEDLKKCRWYLDRLIAHTEKKP